MAAVTLWSPLSAPLTFYAPVEIANERGQVARVALRCRSPALVGSVGSLLTDWSNVWQFLNE